MARWFPKEWHDTSNTNYTNDTIDTNDTVEAFETYDTIILNILMKVMIPARTINEAIPIDTVSYPSASPDEIECNVRIK